MYFLHIRWFESLFGSSSEHFGSQVDRKEVVYVQSAVESVGWEAMDSMTFSAASPPASLDGQTFKIEISYENTGPERNTVLLANTGMKDNDPEFQQLVRL